MEPTSCCPSLSSQGLLDSRCLPDAVVAFCHFQLRLIGSLSSLPSFCHLLMMIRPGPVQFLLSGLVMLSDVGRYTNYLRAVNPGRGSLQKFQSMPTKSRVSSKPPRHTHSARASRQSGSSHAISPATMMCIPDPIDHTFSFPSGLPHRHSIQDRDIPKWVAAKDEIFHENTSFDQGQLYMTDSDTAFLPSDVGATLGGTWDNTMSMGDLNLEQCQPFVTDEQYHVSGSPGSLHSGTPSMFDPLVLGHSLDLSNATYLGSNAVTVGLTGTSFEDDFASGSLSYDPSSSVYMSPPSSPGLQGESWPRLSCNYGVNDDYATQGAANLAYPPIGGFSHQPSSPPSPPMSDSSPQFVLMSDGRPLARSQLTLEMSSREAEVSGVKGGRGHYDVTASTLVDASTRLVGSVSRPCTQSSRPAQRTLKPASEKPRGNDLGSQPPASSVHAKPKGKTETAQPRNHYLYKASPGKDGLFRCPFAKEKQCAHTPTKQKCGYE